MDEVVPALSQVTGQAVASRFTMPGGLELAAVGRVLVVAGDDEALKPYRATRATLIVDDLDDYQSLLITAGSRIVRGPQDVPTGRNLTAILADGVQIEYVEWDRAQWSRVRDQESRPAQ
ncbi:MAG: hypothetical protein ACRDQA_22460 [Nocardioidaceae bacterium]